MTLQSRPLHQPTQITLAVDGPGFPGFPPDTIKVEPHLGTFELSRDGVKLASGALATDLRSHEPPRNSGEGTAVNGPMPLAGGDESHTAGA